MCCKCDRDYVIGKYLKDCECMKSLVDDQVVTFEEIEDTPESAVINPSDTINYCLVAVVLLAIIRLLLLVAIDNT